MKSKDGMRRAVLEFERKCHAMIVELKDAIEQYDGQDLRRAIDEIGDRYGMNA